MATVHKGYALQGWDDGTVFLNGEGSQYDLSDYPELEKQIIQLCLDYLEISTEED